MRILGRFVIKDAKLFATRVSQFLIFLLVIFSSYYDFSYTGKIDFKQPNLCYQVKKKTDWDDYFNTRKLFFKVSNVVEKKNKVYCEVEFPYVIIENKDFKNKNFIIKKGIILKNRLLNTYYYEEPEQDTKKYKISNLYKVAKISKKYEPSEGIEAEGIFYRLSQIFYDFFSETRIKKFKVEMVLTNKNHLMGYKITAKNGVVYYYFKTKYKIVYKVCGKYYDFHKKKISKEKFNEILDVFKDFPSKKFNKLSFPDC